MDAWYHVINRARRGQEAFIGDDYQWFIDILQETSEMFKVGIVAYCLMPTYFMLSST